MNRPVLSARARRWLAAGLTAVLLGYALIVEAPGDDDTPDLDDLSAEVDDKLRIVSTKPRRVTAGGAITVELIGLDSDPSVPLAATLDQEAIRILHHAGHRIVVQVPADAEPGTSKLRVAQGGRRSKARIVQIRGVERSHVLRNVIGGFALLVLGLRTVTRAFRASAGRTLRSALDRLTRSSARGAMSGALIGALGQSTTSTSALAVSLTQAHLLTARGALAMVVGAQLGTVLIAVSLPLAATSEALWVIAIGVLWVALADTRRSRTAGKIVLGCGLLFYGLRLLRSGFTPMFADPQVLPYLISLSGDSVLGVVTCAAAGALLCAVFQGPGPVFALVVGLAESDGLISVRDALAVMGGTPLGSVLSTLVLGWPYGKRPRTLAAGHALLGVAMSGVMLLTLPLWTGLARQLLGTDPTELAYGAKDLFPHARTHLTLALVGAQACATALCSIAVAGTIKLGQRLAARSEQALARARAARAAVAQPPASLTLALKQARVALDALRELRRSQEREPTARAEHAAREASAAIESLLGERDVGGADAQLGTAAVATQHLVRAIQSAMHIAEQGLERDEALLEGDERALESMHRRIEDGLDGLLSALRDKAPVSSEAAQAREIGLNASEADARRSLLGKRSDTEGGVRYRLWLSELFVAYEALGNHLYRLHMALANDPDDDLG